VIRDGPLEMGQVLIVNVEYL